MLLGKTALDWLINCVRDGQKCVVGPLAATIEAIAEGDEEDESDSESEAKPSTRDEAKHALEDKASDI